jgi:hypothetical protein
MMAKSHSDCDVLHISTLGFAQIDGHSKITGDFTGIAPLAIVRRRAVKPLTQYLCALNVCCLLRA